MTNNSNKLYNKKVVSYIKYRGVEQLAARRAHNPKVVSSSLTPATKNFIRVARDCGLLFFTHFKLHKMDWAPFGHKSI